MNRLCLSVAFLVLLGTLGVSALEVTNHKSKTNVPSQALHSGHHPHCHVPPPLNLETRYYFNPSSKLCLPFTYCQSAEHKNHFLTKDECIKTCAKM
ncbi:Pancreatic trypsin inhibitor [Tupaia chinensis]|uniref:Pancreatic trypsin inhibitor n=1 Tax=Tupaia chinensis TaxID=246437 RepID=L9KG10_TUPCH|nr:Pancreatic trypsin inhibitor [Tupaia chinensis]